MERHSPAMDDKGIDNYGWKTRRAGTVAFDIYGTVIQGVDVPDSLILGRVRKVPTMVPVFAQRSELEEAGIEVLPSVEDLLSEFDPVTVYDAAKSLFEDEALRPLVKHAFLSLAAIKAAERLLESGDFVRLAQAATRCGLFSSQGEMVVEAWIGQARALAEAAAPRM